MYMNITYLVGNGFDLNLGLETRYADFITVYKNQVLSDKNLENFRWSVASNLALWSNAELAFGKCTKDFANASDFCDCHADFCTELASYLDKQEDRLHFDSLQELIPDIFVKSIKAYTKGFREEQRQQILNCVDAVSGGITYNFISFNYTRTLDKCIDLARKKSLLGKRSHRGSSFDNSFGSVLHVHGFTDRDMVLGVNDESQIENLKLFEGLPEEFIGQVIKRKTNRLNEEHMDEKCSKLLNDSDLIYIYGMSIGKTDAIWWQRISTLLKNKPSTRLIIHAFDAPNAQLIRTKYLQYERTTKEMFLNYSNISDNLKTSIMERIHISPANIFSPMNNLVNHEKNKSNVLVVTG